MTQSSGIKNTRYIVTVGSDDGTFLPGDHIVFFSDGCIGCVEAQGWLEKSNVPEATKGMKYEIDQEHLKKEKKKARDRLRELELL